MALRKDCVLIKRKRKNATYWYFYYWEGNKRIVKSTSKTVKWQADQKAEDILNTRTNLPKNLKLKEYEVFFGHEISNTPYFTEPLDTCRRNPKPENHPLCSREYLFCYRGLDASPRCDVPLRVAFVCRTTR